MLGSPRGIARRVLGVTRTPTYYLPWITRSGLRCVLILNNVESRFMRRQAGGPFPETVVQFDAGGNVVARYAAVVPAATDPLELPLDAVVEGYGFVTVDTTYLHSDLYVTLGDGDAYTATHGRHEFIETYPTWTRTSRQSRRGDRSRRCLATHLRPLAVRLCRAGRSLTCAVRAGSGTAPPARQRRRRC
jgi:hypothetical protein